MAVTGQSDSMFAANPRTLTFTITDEDTSGSPAKDLTDLTPKFTLTKAGKTVPVLEKTGTVTDAANGILTVTLVPADTAELKPAGYDFQLELFDLLDVGVVVATGTVTILANHENA